MFYSEVEGLNRVFSVITNNDNYVCFLWHYDIILCLNNFYQRHITARVSCNGHTACGYRIISIRCVINTKHCLVTTNSADCLADNILFVVISWRDTPKGYPFGFIIGQTVISTTRLRTQRKNLEKWKQKFWHDTVVFLLQTNVRWSLLVRLTYHSVRVTVYTRSCQPRPAMDNFMAREIFQKNSLGQKITDQNLQNQSQKLSEVVKKQISH